MPVLNSSDDANDLDGSLLMTQRKEKKKTFSVKSRRPSSIQPCISFPAQIFSPSQSKHQTPLRL